MPKGPLIDKAAMCKNFNLKNFTKSSRSTLGRKSNKEFEQKECVSNGCKANNTLTISKNPKVRARRARTLVTYTNSLAHPNVRFHPNQHGGGCHKGRTEIKQN